MRLVVSTTPIDKASTIAKTLVEEQLAACVNIVPKVQSIYMWEDKLCDDEEAMLFLKTTKQKVADLETRLKQLHPYDVPEIISLKIKKDEGNQDYLSWVKNCVK